MKTSEILEFWRNAVPEEWENTCDGIWYPVEKEIRRCAVCFKLTLENLRQAIDWQADMVIVHEPLYHRYDREMRQGDTDPTVQAIHDLLTKHRLPVLRLHDHAHLFPDDFIHMGFIRTLGLEIASAEPTMRLGFRKYTLGRPMTARQIAELCRDRLNVPHPRMAGNTGMLLTKVTLALGGVGSLPYDVLANTDTELFVTGEADELCCAFYAQACRELGLNKSILVLGHCESERIGMDLLGQWMVEKTGVECRYFDTADTYEIL